MSLDSKAGQDVFKISRSKCAIPFCEDNPQVTYIFGDGSIEANQQVQTEALQRILTQGAQTMGVT